MKKYLILFAAAVAALVSCGKELTETENGVGGDTPISFDLSANHPGMTKAVKTGWEAGDAIFVFFDNVAAPKYLKMSYDGSAWSSVEYDGATAAPGALGLKNGDTGNMRAVFLPFGSSATVSAKGTGFVFSKTYFSYYLTATLAYTVTGNKVSGAFNMVIPEGYVQFWVEDAEASDEMYILSTDAVIPTGIASVAADGSVVETAYKVAGDDMPGYKYQGGYLFSGKLNTSYAGTGYYFLKNNHLKKERRDYLVTGKTLESHSAVKLPANGNSNWLEVGPDKYVELKTADNVSLGTWCTCNYESDLPENVWTSSFLSFNDAKSIAPSKDQLQALIDNCSWEWVTVDGKGGMGVKAATGFLFLPAQYSSRGNYWSCDEKVNTTNIAWCLYINDQGENDHYIGGAQRANTFLVRTVQQ